ncbi:hypothetical protein CGC48_01210 [Capnocytophaga cynodegmi]|uniref:DUF4595 domain-containing protein n=1 Tax=Capnocytophaga cynodegmi TaxID=28189 RepID=A0A286NTJ5_9FLAO|nr:hypothetical protein [Capnocytophaga cynodegmi]ATA67362.1 hypothetical protein CGC48_01210 [Capnocytophaga cynodegmi]
MKRNVLLTMTALLTLWVASCGKSDSDAPITPEDKTPMKRIKEVNFAYIDDENVLNIDLITNMHTTQNWSDIYNEKINKSYTLKTAKVSYEYNEAGKITKLTESYEGREDRVKQFSYVGNEMTLTFKNDEGKLESQKVQLDKNGNPILKGYVFNDEGQMIEHRDEKLTWENGNLQKVKREQLIFGEKQIIEHHFSYYTDKPNKNNFFLWDVEGLVHANYGLYFGDRIAIPYGTATKNLVKSLVFFSDGAESFRNDYSYTYDNEGYVIAIKEEAYGSNVGSYTISYPEGEPQLQLFKGFAERVQQGTEKGYTYKLVSDTNGKEVFEIVQPIKVTKDVNGKLINLLVDKVYKHTINYTENNGTRTYKEFELKVFFREHMVTNYQINY